jgi:hypothetical protein
MVSSSLRASVAGTTAKLPSLTTTGVPGPNSSVLIIISKLGPNEEGKFFTSSLSSPGEASA